MREGVNEGGSEWGREGRKAIVGERGRLVDGLSNKWWTYLPLAYRFSSGHPWTLPDTCTPQTRVKA